MVQYTVTCSRINFFIILLIAIGVWTGMAFYIKYIFKDVPLDLKVDTCNINYCNVTNATCCWGYWGRHHFHCESGDFPCYIFVINFTATVNNKNYTTFYNSNDNADDPTSYPSICDYNTTNCYYDIRDVPDTLGLYSFNPVGFWNYFLWGLVLLAAIVITVCLGIWLHSLKWKNDYEEIKSDP